MSGLLPRGSPRPWNICFWPSWVAPSLGRWARRETEQGEHLSVHGAVCCTWAGPVTDLPGNKSKIKENASTAPLRVSNLSYRVWAGPSCLLQACLVHSGSDVTGEGARDGWLCDGCWSMTPTARRGGKVLLLKNTTEKGSRRQQDEACNHPAGGWKTPLRGRKINTLHHGSSIQGTTGWGLE